MVPVKAKALKEQGDSKDCMFGTTFPKGVFVTPEGTQMNGQKDAYAGDPYARYGEAAEDDEEEDAPEVDMSNVEEAVKLAKANPKEVANKRLAKLALELGVFDKNDL